MQSIALSPGVDFMDAAIAAALPVLKVANTVIVVPTAVQIMPVRRALQRQCGHILLPRVTTLDYWLGDLLPSPDEMVPLTALERLLNVQQVLKCQDWLRQALGAQSESTLWGLTQMILNLCDELSAVWLPHIHSDSSTLELDSSRKNKKIDAQSDVDEQGVGEQLSVLLERSLDRIFTRLHQRVLGDEAQLLLTFWRALCGPTDPLPLRWHRLQRLAQQQGGALIFLSPVAATPMEEAFLNKACRDKSVIQITYSWNKTIFAPTTNDATNKNIEADAALLQVWPELNHSHSPNTEAMHIPSQAHHLPRFHLTSCANLEDEATHAAHTLVTWLNQGWHKLALVAQDRIVARRTRALLSRLGISVRDETGWKLSTTRAAATLMSWFDLLQPPSVSSGFRSLPQSTVLLDWLKSPFILAARNHLAAEIALLEKSMRRYQVHSGWQALHAALNRLSDVEERILESTHELLKLLQAHTAPWLIKSQSLQQWFCLLNNTLDSLDMRAPLVADGAGEQLLSLIAQLSEQAQLMPTVPFSLHEFRALLGLHIEQAAFRELEHDSAAYVTFLPLNGARMRTFDAVMMVGCDEMQLPAPFHETLFFSSALRTELGLLDRQGSQRQQLCDLAELLLNHTMDDASVRVCFSWQNKSKSGEPQALAPWLVRLAQYAQAADMSVYKNYQAPWCFAAPMPSVMPAPTALPYLPQRLSAHSYSALRRCPYQFFSRAVLGLGVLDELDDMLEKRDVGVWLHEILFRYHSQHQTVATSTLNVDSSNKTKPSLSADGMGHSSQTLRAEAKTPGAELSLERISQHFFAEKIAQDGHALAYWKRWQKLIPSYLDWQKKREQQGWHWSGGEVALEHALPDLNLTLHGRIDRLDLHADHGWAILDYKTQTRQRLLAKCKQVNEEIQLPFYAWLSELCQASIPFSQMKIEPSLEINQSMWVALEGSSVDEVVLPELAWLTKQLAVQVRQDFTALSAGASLPAYGKEASCRFCEARGLCRKGYWTTSTD